RLLFARVRRLRFACGPSVARLLALFVTPDPRVRRLGLVPLPFAVRRRPPFNVYARVAARIQAEEGERARFEAITSAALDDAARPAPPETLARTEQLLPDDALAVRGQDAGEGAVARVEG